MSDDKKLVDEVLGENLLDHDYDGIMELDNNLPPWWLYMFYGTIIFAVIYSMYFFGMGDFKQQDELNNEIAVAEAQIAKFKEKNGPSIDENSAVLLTDAAQLKDGEEIYSKNCVACHAANGGGGVGPNFTDDAWIHGNTINDLFKTIKYGVPEKGMIPWESQLNPEQIQNVASYILTEFKGKNVEGGKEPQGEKM
ncbi:c-type cytochrome [Vicingus serpentipes]|uniref:C-type cytochrome n=1 Tax=Vicingus serpentipes TaxID=1926625 RepID=A0A5C6RYY6_9FLAO|nr:cbb3-type cytochrome c oxidase N-terminal domain-containing protein [Vicingus serpentipes]TXB67009.1 c-type cytochrome [Vicingus serpentipes]